jgi:hypothetical protein
MTRDLPAAVVEAKEWDTDDKVLRQAVACRIIKVLGQVKRKNVTSAGETPFRSLGAFAP